VPQAQLNLGVCLWEGRGVPRPDPAAAVRWFERAAAAGLAAAQFNLGVARWRGGWLEPAAAPATGADPSNVSRLYRQAPGRQSASGGVAADGSRRDGGGAAAAGLRVVPPNAAAAVGWFEKAALQGDAQAQYNLAGCYKNGEVNGVAWRSPKNEPSWVFFFDTRRLPVASCGFM
jgi:hypothetical protein